MKHRIGTTLVLLLLTGSCVPRASADLSAGQLTSQLLKLRRRSSGSGAATARCWIGKRRDSKKARNRPIRN